MEFPGNERGSEPAKSPEMTWTVEDMQISIDVPGSDKLSAGVSISSSITKPYVLYIWFLEADVRYRQFFYL